MTDTKEIREELGQTVHKIWLAGLGALSSAGEEGAKLFNTLVEKGESYEKQGRERFDDVKSKVEEAAGAARDRAGSTWGKIETKVDESVSAALARLGVPSRDEIATLTKRVEELTAVVEKLKPAAKPAAKKAS
jgi:poly(hydroxyalkanoate) granule-associated protein